jgi:hypothetical protein
VFGEARQYLVEWYERESEPKHGLIWWERQRGRNQAGAWKRRKCREDEKDNG